MPQQNEIVQKKLKMLKEMIEARRDGATSLNAACAIIAEQLDPVRWTGNYLKSFLYDNPPNPSDELLQAIVKLYNQKKKKRKYNKRSWVKVAADSEAEKDEWLERIPMERRSELFREEIARLNGGKEEDEDIKPSRVITWIRRGELFWKKTIKRE
jgi:hypothetical protein